MSGRPSQFTSFVDALADLATRGLALQHDSESGLDAQRRARQSPDARVVLAMSTGAALLIVFLYRYARRFGVDASWLFVKEGPLESFTFVAGVVSSAWMAIATRRVWRTQRAGLVAAAYGGCAFLLFVISMEEISWGQQWLHFGTPQSWAAINYQQETTLHNLVDHAALTSSARVIAYVFAAGAIGLMLLAARTDWNLVASIAPHRSLLPFAALIGYAGTRLHPEIIEALISMFFLFYSYRVLRRSAA